MKLYYLDIAEQAYSNPTRKSWITDDLYNKKFKEYKERQGKILEELGKHDTADKDYHITANTVLNLAKRALEIFKSSEPQEQRQLLNFVFQNLELRQKNIEYKLKTPYDTVLLANKCSDLLPGSDSKTKSRFLDMI